MATKHYVAPCGTTQLTRSLLVAVLCTLVGHTVGFGGCMESCGVFMEEDRGSGAS